MVSATEHRHILVVDDDEPVAPRSVASTLPVASRRVAQTLPSAAPERSAGLAEGVELAERVAA